MSIQEIADPTPLGLAQNWKEPVLHQSEWRVHKGQISAVSSKGSHLSCEAKVTLEEKVFSAEQSIKAYQARTEKGK